MGANRACLVFITIHLVSLAAAQEMSKRVPQGFLGMRGKKYFDDEGIEQFYKRKPQFFVGVKGKKSLQDILEAPEEYYKRAPMGFMGMRGKKEVLFPEFDSNELAPKRDGSLIGQIDYSSSENRNDPDFPLLNELLLQYLSKIERPAAKLIPETMESDIEPLTNEVEKRAANIHQFFGVRGKKSMNNKRPYDLTFRGKFIGVRGKKDLKNSGPHEIKFLLDQNGPLPKRKAQMGFFGMRGKKWADETTPEMDSPN
ncbi:tachykinins isoform X2 [Trichoplusia ni]|uniref:Tachykinins isoform X2 n=1 Tax=Trichoplusia ni TaxID=7111 RepID=A0A7E5W5J1_TRINI|nr:tachykinins isoform X2 [Trichoplusia ni]